jgi:hypothetical protein
MSQGLVGGRRREPIYDHRAADEPQGVRRTVVIRGQVANRGYPSRRPARTMQERAMARPDRVAMWAVFFCVLLLVVAATSGHG